VGTVPRSLLRVSRGERESFFFFFFFSLLGGSLPFLPGEIMHNSAGHFSMGTRCAEIWLDHLAGNSSYRGGIFGRTRGGGVGCYVPFNLHSRVVKLTLGAAWVVACP